MLNRATHITLICILLELFLGGGGRLTAWGPVSLRMVFFSVAIILTFIHLYKGAQLDPSFRWILMIFTTMLLIGFFVGKINNVNASLLLEDVKPLLYFYLLPFFTFAITSRKEINVVNKLIQIAAISMAAVYFIILLLIHSGLITFLDFYNVAFPTGEFFFRGEIAFFYKGFIYMCIGFLIIHLTGGAYKGWFMAGILIAILLTFTRGFLLALALTYFVYYVILSRSYQKAIIAILICGIVVFGGGTIYSQASKVVSQFGDNPRKIPSTTLLGDRQFSDNERKNQFNQVFAAVTPLSFMIGHGFGNGVKSRPIHMEISYLEIFHKQGVLGLTCWGIILFMLIRGYQEASVIDAKTSQVYLLASLLFAFESLTNQYINNPIGLGMVLISFTCLGVIKKEKA